jgi:hypothetical protein
MLRVPGQVFNKKTEGGRRMAKCLGRGVCSAIQEAVRDLRPPGLPDLSLPLETHASALALASRAASAEGWRARRLWRARRKEMTV